MFSNEVAELTWLDWEENDDSVITESFLWTGSKVRAKIWQNYNGSYSHSYDSSTEWLSLACAKAQVEMKL